jgi:hypothetical protein
MAETFANHAGTTLSAAISSTSRPVTFTVASAVGLPSSGNFRLEFQTGEIMLITSISGTSLTGSTVEGTTAATHAAGEAVNHVLTAGSMVQAQADVVSQIYAWQQAVNAASYAISNLGNVSLATGNSLQIGAVADPTNLTLNANQILFHRAGPSYLDQAAAAGSLVIRATVSTEGDTPIATFSSSGLALNAPLNLNAQTLSGNATVTGALTFNQSQFVIGNNAFYFNTANASWQEFRYLAVPGGSASADTFVVQFNTRSTSGGSDAWVNGLQIAAQTGAITFSTATSFTSTAAATFSGQITVTQSSNTPGLILQGASAGWASGLQLNNTTASTGRNFGLYSSSAGSLFLTDITAGAARMTMDANGLFTFSGQIAVTQSSNTPWLILQGASAGWASGLQLNNTTASTGRNFGLYSSSTGSLLLTDVTGGVFRMMIDASGLFTFNTASASFSGQVIVTQSSNTPSLLLQGASAGWASGLQLNNTTASTGRRFGLYSAATGNLALSDETAGAVRMTMDANGLFTFNLGASGSALVTSSASVDIDAKASGAWARSFRVIDSLNANSQGAVFGAYGGAGAANVTYAYFGVRDSTNDLTGYNSAKTIQIDSSGNVTVQQALTHLGASYHASNPLYFNSANASWQEFRILGGAGSSQPNDTFLLQYNTRAAAGGSDSWVTLFYALATGSSFFPGALNLYNVTLQSGSFNLNGQTVSGAGTFSGALTFNGLATFTAGIQANFANLGSASGSAGSLSLSAALGSPLSGRLHWGGDGSGWQFRISANKSGTMTDYLTFSDLGSITVNMPLTFAAASFSTNSSPQYFTTPNATWQEFAITTFKGAAAVNDTLNFQFNQRSTSGGGDSWVTALQIAAQSGSIITGSGSSVTFGGSVTASGSFTFSTPASIAFGSNWVSWAPTLSCSGSMTISSATIVDAQYLRIGPVIYFKLTVNPFTLGGTASSTINATLPVSVAGPTSYGTGWIFTNSGPWVTCLFNVSGTQLSVTLSGLANMTLGTGGVALEGFYRCT